MPKEAPQMLFIDNSRSSRHASNSVRDYVTQQSSERLTGVDGLLSITPECIYSHGITVVAMYGGDGSLSFIMDTMAHAESLQGKESIIVLTGGGSAQTTLSELFDRDNSSVFRKV